MSIRSGKICIKSLPISIISWRGSIRIKRYSLLPIIMKSWKGKLWDYGLLFISICCDFTGRSTIPRQVLRRCLCPIVRNLTGKKSRSVPQKKWSDLYSEISKLPKLYWLKTPCISNSLPALRPKLWDWTISWDTVSSGWISTLWRLWPPGYICGRAIKRMLHVWPRRWSMGRTKKEIIISLWWWIILPTGFFLPNCSFRSVYLISMTR